MGTIVLAVNGEKLLVPSTYSPSHRLIDVLRSETRFTGPKVGCGEGGCGACTVLIDRYDPVTGAVSRSTINSCLATIGSCDGTSITTAEGLGNSKCGFHPVQETLAKHFASQCGYCTPGITVALAAAADRAAAEPAATAGAGPAGSSVSARAVAIARGLDGNLCRCTGWRPIIDAAREIADLEDLHKQQCCGSKDGSSSGGCSSSPCTLLLPPMASFPSWLKQYVAAKHRSSEQQLQQQLMAPAAPPSSGLPDQMGMLGAPAGAFALQPNATSAAAAEDVGCCGGQAWLKPTSLVQVAALLQRHCSSKCRARLVAGNTGAGVFKDLWPHDSVVVDLAAVAELQQVTHLQEGVVLGAGLSIQQLISVLRSPASSSECSSSSDGKCCMSSSCSRPSGCTAGEAQDAAAASAAAAAAGAPRNAAVGHDHAAGAGAGCAPSTTKAVWGGMADHLERIAGVHVRSAATLGGHFGLCAERPLPTDLGLVLAAAGCWLQVLTVEPQQPPPVQQCTAAGSLQQRTSAREQAGCQQQWQQQGGWQQQQQQQQLNFDWVTAEEFLEGSCIRAACATTAGSSSSSSGSSSSSVSDFIVAEGVAGGKLLHPWQQQQHVGSSCLGSAAAGPAAGYRVVTAVWLPYGNDQCELFWSYKVALRHVNSHALVNTAAWFRFEKGSTECRSSCSAGSDSGKLAAGAGSSLFAGRTIVSARLFVGFPPVAPESPGAAAAARQGDELWRVLRVTGSEQQLHGSPVSVQGIVSALRQLECALASSGAPTSSFHSQALQGMLFKALVPLLSPKALPAAPTHLTSSARSSGADTRGSSGHEGSDAAHQQLLRLLQLPAQYDPCVLPEGSQQLPGPSSEQAAAAAPVHQPVEKDAVRLQASGEAQYAADVAARMRGRVLYLASVNSTEALASVQQLDASAALALPGVVGLITAADIPGANEVFGAPLLAGGTVEYVGQPIALLAAASQQVAEHAASLVCVTYGPPAGGRCAIITLDEAVEAGSFYENLAPLMQATAVKPGVAGGRTAGSAGGGAGSSSGSAGSSTGSLSGLLQGGYVDSGAGDRCEAGTTDSSAVAHVERLIAEAPRQVVGGTYSLPAQQHFYMETQVAVAEPLEDGCLRVTSATQSLDAVQQAVSGLLGVPFNKVSVVTKRLGGGFGGKASRSMPVAAAAALAASLFDAPVCYSLSRCDDFAQNAGRCAGRLCYDVGFTEAGKVLAIKAEVLLRAGAYFDLASNDGAQLLAASDSAYDLSGLHVAVRFARCNLPPHTIVRGPGYLQGVMVLEQIMEHVAAELGFDAAAVKAANFLPDVASPAEQQQQLLQPMQQPAEAAAGTACTPADGTAGGAVHPSLAAGAGRLCLGSVAAMAQRMQQQQKSADAAAGAEAATANGAAGVTTILGRYISPETYTLPRVWAELLQGGTSYAEMLAVVQAHNREHAWSKRGIAVTPVRFDCAPAAVSAAVSVFADGSVLVTHGGIEMGQGLSTKVKQAAVATLSQLLPEEQRPLPLSLVRLAPSSSDVVPGGGPSWSSTASEGNCQAVMNAAAKIVAQMAPYTKVGRDALSTWQATLAAICPDVGFVPAAAMLSAYGWFNGSVGSGAAKQPVQYSAFGAALSEVELDVLTGERRVLRSSILYDCGYPLNPAIDLGQVEGAFVMGLGVMLSEDVEVQQASGRLLSGTTWKYKIPHYDLIPQSFRVSFLSNAPNPRGILSSKASGEPALMASTSALMALQAAAAAAASEVAALLLGGVVMNKAGGSGGVVEGRRNWESSRGGSGSGGGGGWRVLSAPATPQKLKGVVGSFSVADVLEATLAAAAADDAAEAAGSVASVVVC